MAIIFPGVWELDIYSRQPFVNRPPSGFDFVEGRQFELIGMLDPNLTVTTESFEFCTSQFLFVGSGGDVHRAVREIKSQVQAAGSDVYAYSLWHKTEFNLEIPHEWRIPTHVGPLPIPFVGGDHIPIPFGGTTLARVEKWTLKILHSAVGLGFFVGVSILVLVSMIALWGLTHMESIPEQVHEITEDLRVLFRDTISAPFAGATQVLVMFVLAGAVFSFAVWSAGRATGEKVKPPTAPAIPGLAPPTVGARIGPPGARLETSIRGAGRERARRR